MPIVVDLLSYFIVLVIAWVIIFEVILPAAQGLPLFPILRKSETRAKISAAEKDLEDVSERERLKGIVNEVDRRKADLEKNQ